MCSIIFYTLCTCRLWTNSEKNITRTTVHFSDYCRAVMFCVFFLFQNPVTYSDLQKISDLVNQRICACTPLNTVCKLYSEVKDTEYVIKLRNHQYPYTVRVVAAGPLEPTLNQGKNVDFSIELCGGT